MMNPKPFLDKLIGQHVSLRVMSGSMYEGTLSEVSRMCDLTLTDAKELVFGKVVKEEASIKLFRDDVMYVRGPKPDAGAAKGGDQAEADPEP